MKNLKSYINRGIRVPVFFFIAATVAIALFIYDDYGIAWDEPWQLETTQVNYRYIFDGDETLLEHEENIYGMAVELPLLFIEKALKLEDTRSIYLMRHLVSHLLWLSGIIVFILLIFRITKKEWLAIMAGIFLYLMPRIFAHSFFNTKDVPFLVFTIFCMYAFLSSYRKPWPGIIWLGLLTGILINIRLMGLLLLVISASLLLLRFLAKKNTRHAILFISLYLVITFMTLWASWPYLWESPFHNLAEAFRIMAQYPWDDPVLYFGNRIPGNQVPWHYAPAWIAISTPIIYLILFFTGLTRIITGIIGKAGKVIIANEQSVMGLFQIVMFFGPLAMVIILNSTLYDDWRQLYFIYPSLVYIAIAGLGYTWKSVRKYFAARVIAIVFIFTGLLSPALFMFRHYPHQQVYLNEFIPKRENYVLKNFDMDYWGVSYRQALEHILENDQRDGIRVMAPHFPALENVNILKSGDRSRLDVRYNHPDPDYFISNYRYHPEPYPYGEPGWSLNIYNSPVVSVWKIN